jgi:hypothetical protein
MIAELFKSEFENIITNTSLNVDDLKNEGLSVRSGNKLFKLSIVETEEIPTDEIKKEFSIQYQEAVSDMKKEFEDYKQSLKIAFDIEKKEMERIKINCEQELKKVNKLPNITLKHAEQGLFVVNNNNNDGLTWFFKCVYAPKFLNEKRIEPSFAKRLMTPIMLKATTNKDNKVISLVVMKIIGNEKFKHYHDTGMNDCWGETFKPSTFVLKTPEEAIDLFTKALVILETINEFSLGNRTPKGLSRLGTIKKHLTDEVNPDIKKSSVTSRNKRSGFDTNINDSLTENTWTVNTQ